MFRWYTIFGHDVLLDEKLLIGNVTATFKDVQRSLSSVDHAQRPADQPGHSGHREASDHRSSGQVALGTQGLYLVQWLWCGRKGTPSSSIHFSAWRVGTVRSVPFLSFWQLFELVPLMEAGWMLAFLCWSINFIHGRPCPRMWFSPFLRRNSNRYQLFMMFMISFFSVSYAFSESLGPSHSSTARRCMVILQKLSKRTEVLRFSKQTETKISDFHTMILKSICYPVSLAAGVTLGSSAIRRRPNAFNLLHQMETMTRGGYSQDSSLQKLAARGLGQFQTFQILVAWVATIIHQKSC